MASVSKLESVDGPMWHVCGTMVWSTGVSMMMDGVLDEQRLCTDGCKLQMAISSPRQMESILLTGRYPSVAWSSSAMARIFQLEYPMMRIPWKV